MEPRAQVLKSTFDIAHMVFNAVTADLTDSQCAYVLQGGTVPRAAAIVAHAVFGEDVVINRMARGIEPVLQRGGFMQRTGISAEAMGMTPEWLAMDFKIEGLREYAEAVFAETSSFHESATAEMLDRSVDTPLGTKMPAAEAIGAFGIVHVSEHTGEISALIGAQGGKGLPF